ncbi:MAG: Vps62-related protein [bacterium]|nr:Vps62-related protein [bacterium]
MKKSIIKSTCCLVFLLLILIQTGVARPPLVSIPFIPDQTATMSIYGTCNWYCCLNYSIEDPECFESLTRILLGGPAGMRISGGNLVWNATPDQIGCINEVSIKYVAHGCDGDRIYYRNFEIQLLDISASTDSDGDSVMDSVEQYLLERYAPVVKLHPDEENYPSSVEWYLEKTVMRYNHSKCYDCPILDEGEMTVSNITTRTHRDREKYLCYHRGTHWSSGSLESHQRKKYFLQVPNRSGWESFVYAGADDAADWRCYAHVRTAPVDPADFGLTSPLIDIQYWFFYPRNGYIAPHVAHEGDWEHITVRVLPSSHGYAVWQIFLAQHNGGVWREPQEFSYSGTHPIVYAAKHSHACYKDTGTHYVTLLFIYDHTGHGTPWNTINNLVNVGELADPVNGQNWLQYNGRWGEIGQFEFTTGPYGPAFQSKFADDGGGRVGSVGGGSSMAK